MPKPAVILGISAFYHDSAAALLVDGRLMAAAHEERFTRLRHDAAFPAQAVSYCLRAVGLAAADVDHIVFYDKPFLKFERLMFSLLDDFPRGAGTFIRAMPLWFSDKLWIKSTIRESMPGLRAEAEVLFCDHHASHAASAFFASPYPEAALLTVDGVGEWSTSTWGVGSGASIELTHETRFPHSLGLLYSAFTYYLGFKVNSAEYKVMGLAPYGKPTYYGQVRQVVDWKADGSFRLNTEYFDFVSGLRMTNEKFAALFGGPRRQGETRLTQREFDIAASIQRVTDEIMLAMASHVRRETGQRRLCMAGGVALNCVANARVLAEAGFDELWVQPAAGDAGGALGAALYLHHAVNQAPRTAWHMEHALWGPEFNAEEIQQWMLEAEAVGERAADEGALCERTAALIAEGKVVGWFQGRMEYGPRALGARSILADPRHPDMKNILNQKIKFREGFRPFAPSVLEERAAEWFELPAGATSPFMLLVAQVAVGKPSLPSITHVDGSARLQTVSAAQHPRYHRLLSAFEAHTGVPVLINTSFNVRGEPIVCTPADAYRCFMRTNMDALVLGDFLFEKSAQPPWREPENADWRREFALD